MANGGRSKKLKAKKQKVRDELRREYDLAKLKSGVRGKYAARYKARVNLVVLSRDAG